MNIQTKRGLG